MKQTAVEWLVKQLNKEGFAQVITDEEIEQARAMEKEQIMDAWINSLTKGDYNSAEQYYNETFKSE